MNEWRLLKKLVISDQVEARNIVVNSDDNAQPFSVEEVYIRVNSIDKLYSYISIDLGINKHIGEARGNMPCEIFIKNIGGFWRMFYISYSGTYGDGKMSSWGAFHPGYIHTIQEIPTITQLKFDAILNIEAEIYAR